MINSFSIKWHRLLQSNKPIFFIVISVIALLGVQTANHLLFHLLGLPNTVWPWSFIQVLSNGFVFPVCVAFVFVFCPLIACFFYYLGGVERTIANHLLLYWLAFILLNCLGIYLFIEWGGYSLSPYPWLIYSLLLRLPENSEAYHHLMIVLFISYSPLFFMMLYQCFSSNMAAENIFGKAHFANVFEIAKAKLYKKQGIVVGKHQGKLLRVPGYEGALVIAPMGQGKTTAIAIPNLLEWKDSVVVNDLKGELYETTVYYRKNKLNQACYRFAPSDVTIITDKYNPFYYVSKNPKLRIRDLQLIAEILIPAERVDGGFWYTSARDLFLLLALYLLESKGMATLAEIHDLSKREDFFEWLALVIAEEKINEPVFYQNANSLLNSDGEKTQKNILKDFHSRLVLFTDPLIREATSGNDFDFRNLRKEKMSIYLQIPESDKERLKPILTLFWAQLIHAMSEKEPNKIEEPYDVLALLDEFGNMAKIQKLKNGISFLRSYRVRTIIMVQYLSQIISTYGTYDAKGFLNSKVKIAFTLNDLDDAKFISECLGKKTIKVKTSSASQGRHSSSSSSVSFQSRLLMTPDEIMQMKSSQEIILMEGSNPIKANKCYWFKEMIYQRWLSEYQLKEKE